MAQSLTRLFYHIIFSTKHRTPLIFNNVRSNLHAFMAHTLTAQKNVPVAIGGTNDHVHLLLLASKNVAPIQIVENAKTESSKWIKTQDPRLAKFYWQAGYGMFSVSESHVDSVKNYIEQQDEHHRTITFQEEYIKFLKHYRVPYDERYVWD